MDVCGRCNQGELGPFFCYFAALRPPGQPTPTHFPIIAKTCLACVDVTFQAFCPLCPACPGSFPTEEEAGNACKRHFWEHLERERRANQPDCRRQGCSGKLRGPDLVRLTVTAAVDTHLAPVRFRLAIFKCEACGGVDCPLP